MRAGESQAFFLLAEIARAAGQLPEARRLHEQALEIRRSMNETRTMFESRVALAELALDEGRPTDAEHDARQQAGAAQPEFERTRLAALQIGIARARIALADPAGAAAALDLARPLVAKSERIDPRHAFAIAEAEVEAARGNRDRARTQLSALCSSLEESKMVLRSRECRTALTRVDPAR